MTKTEKLQADANARHRQFANTLNEMKHRLTVEELLDEIVGQFKFGHITSRKIPALIAISGIAWVLSKAMGPLRGRRSVYKLHHKNGDLK